MGMPRTGCQIDTPGKMQLSPLPRIYFTVLNTWCLVFKLRRPGTATSRLSRQGPGGIIRTPSSLAAFLAGGVKEFCLCGTGDGTRGFSTC